MNWGIEELRKIVVQIGEIATSIIVMESQDATQDENIRALRTVQNWAIGKLRLLEEAEARNIDRVARAKAALERYRAVVEASNPLLGRFSPWDELHSVLRKAWIAAANPPVPEEGKS